MSYKIVNKLGIDIFVWGDVDDNAIQQMATCSVSSAAKHTAIMADGHLGFSQAIGGVVAYKGLISVSGCGYDIACGNMAVRLKIKADFVRKNIKEIMDKIFSEFSFGKGGTNSKRIEHALFDNPMWKEDPCKSVKQIAQDQLGSIGSGNHYCDIFIDENDDVWAGVHFGSRKFGHVVASHFLNAAGAKDDIFAPPCLLKEDSDLGEQYIRCMNLAGEYAYVGREWVCEAIAGIMHTTILEEVHNHHNFAFKENFDGEDLWVIRKGSTPLHPGQKSFIGGSMGDISVICQGTDNNESLASLHSAPHGAGRVMGRMEAKGKKKICKDPNSPDFGKERIIREPKITKEMMESWLKEKGVYVCGGGVDESPHAYRRLPEVLKCHEDYIKILHTLTPIGVAMAED